MNRQAHASETVTIEFDEDKEYLSLFRSIEENLELIEESLEIKASSRGNRIFLKGPDKGVKAAEKLIRDLRFLRNEGTDFRPEDVRRAILSVSEGGDITRQELVLNNIPVASKRRFVAPKIDTQSRYIEAIKENDIVVGIGPAGTGKTYLAMAMAINAFLKKQVSRIVLARPAIEAGEKLGFLPGDMYEKVNPYLRPLYDALYDMMEAEKASRLMEKGVIEIAPLAFMRGRTLNDSFIILDEAQNTTAEQMKMYLTRLGFNSKTVITGDITQIDLPAGKSSGLVEIERILHDIAGISFIHFSEKDVVRHKLVQEIVKAYEKHEKRHTER